MANEEKFEKVTLTKGDEVRVAETPAALVQLKWDGFVEKSAPAKKSAASTAAKTDSK